MFTKYITAAALLAVLLLGPDIASQAQPDPLPAKYDAFMTVNYVRTWTAKAPEKSAANLVIRPATYVTQTTQYYDALGRPVQTVVKQASPLQKDMVVPTVYDSYGREGIKYLPFVSNVVESGDIPDDGNFKLDPFQQQAAFYNNQLSGQPGETNVGPDNLNWSYSKASFESSPLNRVTNTYAPGSSWVGISRGTGVKYLVNTALDNVRIWTIAQGQGSIPSSSEVYTAGQLYKGITTDEKGLQTIIYKNKSGQTILQKVQYTASADNGSGSPHAGWLCTYYVYDDYNHLRFIITPKAVELIDGTWGISQTIADELCFRYEYDGRGRAIVEKAPGSGEVQMVYDLRSRLVFSQDGNQRDNHQWLMTYYDVLDRPVETALYTDLNATRQSLQTMMDGVTGNSATVTYSIPATADLTVNSRSDNTPSLYTARNSITFLPGFESGLNDNFTTSIDPNAIESSGTLLSVGTGNPVPSILASSVMPLTYTFYDNYTWDGHQDFQGSYLGKVTDGGNLYAESPTTFSGQTRGLITGTKVRILNSNPEQWLTSTLYYDDKRRILQVISDNITGGTDVMTNKYDFSGKLLSSYMMNHNNQSSLTPETRVLTENNYDAGGRLLTITKTINDDAATQRVIATYAYDELGQLKTAVLGNNLETLTYDYNVRGWLTGINKNFTLSGNADNYFGMEIGYDKSATSNGTTTFSPVYNGNIGGEIWKSKGDNIPRKYAFTYDNVNRLTAAAFSQNSSGSTWDNSTVDFSVSNLGYDANGNIVSMNQKGLLGASSGTVDNLTYHYQTNSNKLDNVTDIGGTTAALGDFKDGHAGIGDYAYDANGSLIKDMNRKISSITYNYLNLPEQITITDKGSIRYVYDAAGNKLQKIVTDNTGPGTITTTTDYMGGFVYRNDTLRFFGTEDGRVRTLLKSGQSPAYTYDYFVRDNLGNVRVVLTEQTDFTTYLATMEPQNATTENALFYNVDNTREATPLGYPEDNTTSPNKAVAKLNGMDPAKRIGPSIILRVMAGDTIEAAVRAFYHYKATPKNNAGVPAEQMAIAVLQALSLPMGPMVGTHISNAEARLANSGADLGSNEMNALRRKTPAKEREDKPKAYLNYVFFDDQFNFVENGSGAKQVSGEPDELETLASGKIVARKTGYVYVYTSNASQQDVLFDNMGVMQITGPVLEERHYYPDGLTMAGISSRAMGRLHTKLGYQGKEIQNEEFGDGSGLEAYDFGARFYDLQLGRWMTFDPAGQYASGYVGMGNNWTMYVDKDGRFALAIAAAIGAVVGAGINVVAHWSQITAGGFHWDKFGEAALIGGAAGAVGVLTGGAAFAAAGGAAAGAGGFLAGAASGAVGSAYSSMIEGVGNGIAFGDPYSPEQLGTDILFGAVTAGVLNGTGAALHGRNFWTGKFNPLKVNITPLGNPIPANFSTSDDVGAPQRVMGSPQRFASEGGEYFANPNGGFEPTLNRNVEGFGAKLPVGRRGNVLEGFTPGISRNKPTIINGIKFTGHALDQMQNRGIISPTAVLDVIKNPARIISGNTSGTVVFFRDNLKVIINKSGDVISVIWQ